MLEKLVTLRLEGNLDQKGFQVTLEMGLEGERPQIEVQGFLPPDMELAMSLKHWQQSYQGLGLPSRIRPQEIVYGGSINRVHNCRQMGRTLSDRFEQWLRSDSFQVLNLRLREELQKTDLIRIVLRSPDRSIRQLPWSDWDLLRRFPQTELVLSAPTFERLTTESQSLQADRKTVRILAILGHSQDIDVESDRQRLMNLPDAEVTFLVEPDRQQISDRLWEQCWDILFFAGHSQTQDEAGRIYINPHDSLTIAELRYGLQRAIAQGLQLAIFNSCDGLGLATELESLHLPQIIVMREPVPDRVAQSFLHYFLSAFASDMPLHLAVRQARERLQGLEDEFPYASWLPILCQPPNVRSLTWNELRGDSIVEAQPISFRTVMLTSFCVSALVAGVQFLGLLQAFELNIFDQWIRLRPAEPVDDRILIITVDEADIQYQDAQGMERRGSLSDQALSQLLETIAPYQPRVIGLDIFHDFEFSPESAIAIDESPAFVATCEIAATANHPSTIAAPPGFSSDRLGFSDIPVDLQSVIRRQFLGMSSEPDCPTDRSLGLQVALRYLESQNISDLHRNEDGDVQIGEVLFPQLTHQAGGYQLPVDESRGYQIVLNYRQAEFQQVSLRSLLSGELDGQIADYVSDRIVLIGVDGSGDVHLTPHSQGQLSERVPGIVVHAHIVSQLISAVLDQRPLFRWLPPWGEVVWIGLFSGVGALLGDRYFSRHSLEWPSLAVMALILGGVTLLIYGLCFVLLLMGWWMLFVAPVIALLTSSISIGVLQKSMLSKRS